MVRVHILPLSRQSLGDRYVPCLGGFIAASQKHDCNIAALGEIHPITRTVIDPHLAHAITDRLDVASMPIGQPVNPDGDLRHSPMIT
jgi:hypothetical protein